MCLLLMDKEMGVWIMSDNWDGDNTKMVSNSAFGMVEALLKW